MPRLLLLLALIWIPFLSIFGFANPTLAASVGDSYPHIAFHVFAPVLLVTAFVLVQRFRLSAPTRLQRALAWILTVTVPLAVLGNLVELVAAVVRLAQDGWVSLPTPDVFAPGSHLHALAANVTVPSLMVSMLAAGMLVLSAALQGRRKLEPVG